MQNNERSNSGAFRKFFQEKGYYIVLFLCIAAVGISGYIFVRSAISEKNSLNDETLSVATTTTVPSAPESSKPIKPAAQAEDSAVTAAAEDPGDLTPASKPDPDETVRAAASSVRVWPVSGEAQAAYSVDALQYNATTQDWRTHAGVDLTAAVGTPVRAAGSGVVTAVYDDEYLGTTVIVNHPDGHVSQYSNLAVMPSVSAGDSVEAGQTIGAVGATALLEIADEPHLHFAVYANGDTIDPAEFIR